MNKLICYAISPAALALLTQASARNIPPEWFNWLGAKPPGQLANVARLCMAEQAGQPWREEQIIAWDRACRSLGYDTALVMADNEAMVDYDLCRFDNPGHSVHPEAGFILVSTQPTDGKDRVKLLRMMQRPDDDIWLAFSAMRRGGGIDLGASGYSGVAAFQWWILALEIDHWTGVASQPNNEQLHPEDYPLNDWRRYSRGDASRYDKDTVISADDFFVNAYSNQLQALKDYDGPSKAWCRETVPGFDEWRLNGQALKAVYPMRSLPFCGVAELLNGELKPYGGFASLTEPWAWDARAEVRGAINEWVKVREGRGSGQKPKRAWDNFVEWIEGAASFPRGGLGTVKAPVAQAKSTLGFLRPGADASPSKSGNTSRASYSWTQRYADGLEIAFTLQLESSVVVVSAVANQPIDWGELSVIHFKVPSWDPQQLNDAVSSAAGGGLASDTHQWTWFEFKYRPNEIAAFLKHSTDERRVYVC